MVAGDQSDPVDVLIIGAGPGGYVAALRAAQLGRSVTLVEAARVGGVCLNEGCIPSKQLGRFAAAKAAIERLAVAGMPALAGAPDLLAFQRQRKQAITTLVQGVEMLLKAARVVVVAGEARFVGRTRVCVQVGEESVRYFDFKDVVIATGSEPVALTSHSLFGRPRRHAEPGARMDRFARLAARGRRRLRRPGDRGRVLRAWAARSRWPYPAIVCFPTSTPTCRPSPCVARAPRVWT